MHFFVVVILSYEPSILQKEIYGLYFYIRNYILIGIEIMNGSCSTVSMKTSLFEYSKVWMLDVLSLDKRIVKVSPVQKVVAKLMLNTSSKYNSQSMKIFTK